jgi:hypothetical protein
MLQSAIETYPDLYVVALGLDPAGVSQSVDALKKSSYHGFKQGDLKPA